MKNKNNLFLILGVALVAVVLGSVVTASITGFAVLPGLRMAVVKDNSCNADNDCEVNRLTTIGNSILQITSASKYIRMLDKVIIQKYLIFQKFCFKILWRMGRLC